VAEPGFFLVGAPKCGTTSLYRYLEQHPQVFLPEQKELNFFAADLFPGYMSERQYRRLFAPAGEGQTAGESSVWYLYSRAGARNIQAFAPAARIIIMLRDPVEMLYSLHSQHYFQGMEPEADFAAALKRRADQVGPLLDYPAIGRYTQQVCRYLERFGSDQVHIILYQNFKQDPLRVYRETLAFLGLDPDFTPEIRVHNANKMPRSRLLRRLSQLPSGLLQPLRAILPFRLRRRLIQGVVGRNTRYTPRPPLAPALADALRLELAPDIRQLSRCIDRDLDLWLPGRGYRAVCSQQTRIQSS